MTMLKGGLIFPFSLFIVLCILASWLSVEASRGNASAVGRLVQKHERKPLVVTEYGEISAVNVSDGTRGSYHLQFITLEPNSIFLPVLLHADMVFYVHTGSGTLSWADDNEMNKVNIRKGDIYRLHAGSVFYVQSSLEPEREKLRIHAIFSNIEDNIYEPSIGAYLGISDLVLGFDSKVLQAVFKAPEGVIEEIMKATKPPAIINAVPKKEICEWQARLLKAFLGSNRDGFDSINGKKKKKKKKKTKAFNVLEADPDLKNCNGWSLTVDKNEFSLLRDSNIGVFMVNLTKGSMMGPHWNPRASEIAIVLQGQGMIRVVCSSNANESECKNLRFRVKEGDVFTVPRFHPMAQMSFNNDSFVFMGFSTSTNRNHPQFLAGKRSVIGVLDGQLLAVSFNVTNTTIEKLLTPQNESVILDCASCAEEEEESIMEEEIEREREEEEERKKKEEEEAEKRKEEEGKKRREEERKKEKQRRSKEGQEQEEPKRKEEKGRQEERRKKEKAAATEQEEATGQEKERQRRAEHEEEDRREREKQRGQPEKRETEEWRRGQKKSFKESMEDFLVLGFA